MHQPLLSTEQPLLLSSPPPPNKLGASKEGAAGSWKLRWSSARCFSILGLGMEREREEQWQNKKKAVCSWTGPWETWVRGPPAPGPRAWACGCSSLGLSVSMLKWVQAAAGC